MKKKQKVFSLIAALALSTTAFASDYSSWGKHKTLTLSTVGITTSAVKKIPVLVRFNVTNQFDMFTGTTAALANGADLRVTKADSTTDIPFEVDSWTTGTKGSGALWVLLDSVPQNSATAYSIRVYWNKAGATTVSAPATVFSPSNGYLAVWHFNQPTGSPMLDATGNGNTATPGSGAAPTDDSTSVIGMGKTFDGTSQFYQVGTDSTALSLNTNNGPYTITAWANSGSCPSGRVAVIAKYANDNSAGSRQYALQTGPTTSNWRLTDDPTLLSDTTANNEFAADAAGACTPGAWTYLAGTYFSATTPAPNATSAANAIIYVNGGTSPNTGVTASQATGSSIGKHSLTMIGRLADNATPRFMDGPIDELTVSNVVRAADWINLSYDTQKAGSTDVTIGASVPATAAVVPGAPTGVTATGGTSGQITVNWVAPVFTGGATITGYTAKAVQDTTKKCTTTGTLTCNVTGLTNTTSYTFTVIATNSAGSSPASAASTPVTGIFGSTTQNSFNYSVIGSSVMFHLPQLISGAHVSVLDLKGREVWSQNVKAGTSDLMWNGKTTSGSSASGIYLVRLTSDSKILSESKISLMP